MSVKPDTRKPALRDDIPMSSEAIKLLREWIAWEWHTRALIQPAPQDPYLDSLPVRR